MHGRPVGNTGARQSKIELVAAVRMVARGCACERTLGLGSACGGGRKRLCHPWLLKSRVEPSGNLLIGGLSYGGARFFFRLGWPNRGLCPSSRTSKSPETVLNPSK